MTDNETWAYIEGLLIEECGLMPDGGLNQQRANFINAISNGAVGRNAPLLKAAAEFLRTANGLTGLSKIRVNGRMMTAGDIADALAIGLSASPAPGAGGEQTVVAALVPWRDELSEIIGHLGSAINQSVASDDQIIMDHVKAAHEIAKIVRRKA